jgi:hypothetical protein
MCSRSGAINEMLPRRILRPRGYLACKNFLAYCPKPRQQWASNEFIGNMLMCVATLTGLIVIGGAEQNPGPVWWLNTICKYCVVGVRGI